MTLSKSFFIVSSSQGSIYLIFFGFFLSIAAFVVEILVARSRKAAQKLNKELKKIKDMAIEKGILLEDNNKASSFGNESDVGIGRETKKVALITSKNQFLANMLMEYEGVVRMQQQRQQQQNGENQKEEKTRKFGLRRKRKRDSVRVRTVDNREEYFSYVQWFKMYIQYTYIM